MNTNDQSNKVFKKPRGSIVIYNTFGIHKAKPTKDKNFVRKSLFFQVDREINHSDHIVIISEYLTKFDERVKLFLGFGKKAGQKIYPNTNLDTMPMNKETFVNMSKWFIARLSDKLPVFMRKRVRRLLGSF